MSSPIAPEHGQVSGDPLALKEIAAVAVKEGDFQRACRMYTLALDILLGAASAFASPAADIASVPSQHDWVALEAKSNSLLHILLCNRSFTHLKLGDMVSAAEDAEHCVCCAPDYLKGHLRLLAALNSNEDGIPVEAKLRVVSRGLRACPGACALLLAKDTLVAECGPAVQQALEMEEASAAEEQLALTRAIADGDPENPRCAIASGDLGSAYAVGAFGLEKDTALAEQYLRRGAGGGDAASCRNLGLLLLSLDRAEEASEQLRAAADLGDGEAAETLKSLGREADQKREQAMFKLRAMAQGGDERARALLVQLDAEAAAVTMQQAAGQGVGMLAEQPAAAAY